MNTYLKPLKKFGKITAEQQVFRNAEISLSVIWLEMKLLM